MEKEFDYNEIPFGILQTFGISPQMFLDLPKVVLDRLYAGLPSPNLPVELKLQGGYVSALVKIHLVRNEENAVDIMFLPQYETFNKEEFPTLTASQREKLAEGKPVIAFVQGTNEKGEPDAIRKFLQLDTDQKAVISAPTQVIARNLHAATTKYSLTSSEVDSILEGNVVTKTITDADSEENYNVTLGVDLRNEHGIAAVEGGTKEWQELMETVLPKYSFGAGGCWVSENGALHYVQDEDFTEDIIEALEIKQGIRKPAAVEADTQHETSEEEEEVKEMRR